MDVILLEVDKLALMVKRRGITQSSVESILAEQYSNDTQESTLSHCIFGQIF